MQSDLFVCVGRARALIGMDRLIESGSRNRNCQTTVLKAVAIIV